MSKSKEMTVGSKYGSWEVLGLAKEKTSCGGLKYNCRCSCGTERSVDGSALRTGKTTQCQKCSNKTNYRKALDAQANKASYFYAMRSGQYVKFGVSNDPERRLKNLLSSNPYDTELIWSEPNEEGLENFYHTLYADRHHRGEWFKFV